MTSRHKQQRDQRNAPKRGSKPRFKRRHAMSIAECQAMLEAQRGLCGCCQQPFPGDIYVDRDRASRLRSLLCERCDSAVRFLEEYPHFPAQADRYFSECPEAESCIAIRERGGESCQCLRMRAKLQSTLEVWPYGVE